MATDVEDAASSDLEHQDPHPDAADDGTRGPKDQTRNSESNVSSDSPNGAMKSKSSDANRPRRKKARRACFACQRAHLTCGDERPCQRCIKRGLQDQCQDGVRKKAKYLHDAPAEALIPPSHGGTYNLNGNHNPVATQHPGPVMQSSTSAPQQSIYYPDPQPMAVDMYPQVPNVPTNQPQHQASANNSFGPHSSASYNDTAQNSAAMQAIAGPGQQTQNMQFPFDPSDPALFNYDIAGLNFGNQYGALEFGMLEHMASTANNGQRMGEFMPLMNQQQYPNAIPLDPQARQQPQQSQHSQPSQPSHSHQKQQDQPQRQSSFLFGRDAMMNVDWKQKNPPPPSNPALETPHNTPIIPTADRPDPSGPPAYAIGARPNSLASASPISIAQDIPHHDLNSPSLLSHQAPSVYGRGHQASNPGATHSSKAGDIILQSQSQTSNARKRALDGDQIYDNVKSPYSYTAGFHRLLHYIKTHLGKEQILRIAQALAAIRPALLTFAQQLTNKDLIYMEIAIQRKLLTYENFIKAYGTPTVIIRRDGAIVAVSQEFVILTGWSKEVLLGHKPNLNVNHGGTVSAGASTIGTNSGRGTRRPSAEPEANGAENTNASSSTQQRADGNQGAIGGPFQSVLIAEIMSPDTVVDFYVDYARLGFSDTMGRAMRRGKLLKYKTSAETPGPLDRAAEAIGKAANGNKADQNGTKTSRDGGSKLKHDGENGTSGRIAGESAFVRLGEKEGVVDCMYCWFVRRDDFEVPQLIVMNFLPVISPSPP